MDAVEIIEHQNVSTVQKRLLERGSAALFTLLGVCFLLYYARFGYEQLGQYMKPNVHLALATFIAVVTLFSGVYALYCLFLGRRNPRLLRKNLLRRADELFYLTQQTNSRIAEIETKMLRSMLTVSVVGMRTLGALKRVVRSIELRVKEAEPFLYSWKISDVYRAEVILNKNLTVTDSAFDWVMDAEQIPPLAPGDWSREIERLIGQLQGETQQVAA